MFIVMLVGLYTSRVVLNTLGVVDYGIYAVVGGPIAIFGFLNASMASSTQRYLNFELGRGNYEKMRHVFMAATYVHAIIAFIIFILAETIGLWLLNHKMVIPPERLTATMWSYQILLISAIISILCSPYNAAIIAHEKMGAFAYVSILDVSLKLLIVYVIQIIHFDKLILYSLLLLGVRLLIRYIYGLYCKRHFEETKWRLLWNRPLLKEMSSFALWNLWGNMASAFYGQGLNILLNMFFGPRVNAARNIAFSVMGHSSQLASGFQTAVNPQITKNYAQGNLKDMHKLLYRSCKFSCFLILIIGLPVFIEAPMILKLWLKIVPEYTVAFVRFALAIVIVDSIARPLMIAATATGKVKLYQSVVGGILLLIVAFAYIVLKLGGNPVSVYIVQLVIICIAFIVRLLIVRPMINLSLRNYLREVILVCVSVITVSLIFSYPFKFVLPHGVWSSALLIVISMMSVAICSYLIGFSVDERHFVNNRFLSVIRWFKK